MSQHIYYAQIRNTIASEFLKKPKYLFKIEPKNQLESSQETITALCSEAAHIFDSIQNLSEGCCENLNQAIHSYATSIVKCLIKGEKLAIIDLIVMAGQTLQNFS